MILYVSKRMLLLSYLSGSILIGMDNECCSVQIKSALRVTSDRGPVRMIYPILVTDKTRNVPPLFYSFDHPIKKITYDSATKHIALITLSDESMHRFDVYQRKELVH